MDYYELNICGVKRKLPICDIGHGIYIAGFDMLGDVELINCCANRLYNELNEKIGLDKIDIILTAETKGIPIAHALCTLMGIDYVVLRKNNKLYFDDPTKFSSSSISTKGSQDYWLSKSKMNLLKNKNILILDDVVSLGGSLSVLEEVVNFAGGRVVSKAFVLAEGDACKRKDIIFMEKLPLFKNEDGNFIKIT